jgi:ribonuclease HI
VPEHAGVEGNEQADQTAKQAAVKSLLPQDSGKLLLAHMQRGLTEMQIKKY